MDRIEEIEKRLTLLPRLFVKETHVPRMIRDEVSGKRIVDPKGGSTQSRVDIIDLDDPALRPWIHFHPYPDHPMYVPSAKETGQALVDLIQDARDMVLEIKKLKGEKK